MWFYLGQAKAGHGQIVGVMGEPGLGKSRLFYEFKLLFLSGCLVLEAYSVSHGKASPYLPVIELLKSYFRIEPLDDERTRREKVTGKVLNLDRNLEDTLPYLFALLGIEEQPSPLQQMDPQIRWRRTFEALKKLFLRESLNQPLVLIFEDLHWIDSETQGFLDTISEGVASAKILLLVNYRPEYRQEWGHKTYYTQVRLAPFGKAEAEEFLDVLLGVTAGPTGRSPLHDLKQLILEKTEGTPFFMEEIVQELREQGVLPDVGATHASPLPMDLHIPSTVQAVLAARIDRLTPDEKALLQQLSVIGREFPLSLVKQVLPQPEADFYRLLASLQRKEFLYEQPAFPEVEYLFKHALTQEVAYGTVLQEQRKLLHERTGQALETVYMSTLSEHYDDLAHHYSRSANTEKAITYLQLAGQQAAQRSANPEAISHLTAALDLLLTRPETPERAAQELTLRLTVGPALMVAQGWTAPAVEQHYTPCRALCAKLGDASQRFPVLWGLWMFHIVRGDIRTVQALAEECLQIAEQTNETGLLLEAHLAIGDTFFIRGELVRARVALERSMALYQPQHHALTPFYGGFNPQVVNLAFTAWALWALGSPEQALRRMHEVVHLAQELGHPLSLVIALFWAAWLHRERGEGRVAQEHADAGVALASEHGFPFYVAWGTVQRGVALIAQEQWAEGIVQVRQGLEAQEGETLKTGYLAWLAEGYGGAGQIDEGLAAVAEALRLVEKNDERIYEAELYRLYGELSLRAGETANGRTGEKSEVAPSPDPPIAPSSPEACFLKAVAIAQKQQAKSLELRAVMSLVRLRQQQATQAASRTTHHEARAKLDEAHNMLSEVYTWFTEGFDTKDLQEAKALLEKLQS